MSAKTRYFRKCVVCAGQGKRVTRGNGHTVTISCACEGGFVDCTKEIEAMRGLLERLTKLRIESALEQVHGSDHLLVILELPAIQEEAKALLAKIAESESVKTGLK